MIAIQTVVRVAQYAGATTAVITAFLAAWRIPFVARFISWVDQHRREDRLKAFEASLERVIGPRLTAVEVRSQQLAPNGGSSLNDRVAKMEEVMVTRGDTLDRVVSQLDDLQTDMRVVLRKVSL